MAKKGDQARQAVNDIIVKAFSEIGAYVTTQDKKIYVNVQDGPGGEVCQFAIAMTMPKTQVSAGAEVGGSQAAWDNAPQIGTAAIPAAQPTELSAEDKAKVDELMKSLGL